MRASVSHRLSSWMLTAFAAVASLAHADTQTLESIQQAAEKEVMASLPGTRARYYVSASRLDPRLRLVECAAPLEASLPPHATPGAKVTVGVRCPAPSAWNIYVPVTVEIEAPILVLRRALARQSPIDATDVELQTRRLPGVESAFVSDVTHLRGRHLRRALPAGTVLTADALVADVLVKRGQQVTLLASNGPFEIRAQGEALSDGGENERIRVQNVTSRKIVEGVVENSSTVRVGF